MVLVAGAGVWLWSTYVSPAELMELEPLQYTEDSSWAALPVSKPAAVWEDGWGVDVFVILSSSGLKARNAQGLERRESLARRQAQAYKADLGGLGAIYTPLYRDAALPEDSLRAFETYLRTQNLGRGLIIAHDEVVPGPILERIASDASLQERFGGFLELAGKAAETDEEQNSAIGQPCGGFRHTEEACRSRVNIAKSKGAFRVSQDGFPETHPIAAFREYLNANVGMMAEPLGQFEEVEIIDIRRPGDTDENRARNTRN